MNKHRPLDNTAPKLPVGIATVFYCCDRRDTALPRRYGFR